MTSNRTRWSKLQQIARAVRIDILDISYKAHVGHIGPALSIVDILTVLYFGVLKGRRDRFILSKGHAAAALFAILTRKGLIKKETLATFCREGGAFGDHPDYNPAIGIELTTGSLGHGLSVGTGMAFGVPKSRIFVLLSDAELNEGSVWEAALFAGHHGLGNLTAIIDNNGQQAFGKTRDVVDTRPLDAKWKSFGWNVHTVNGHNHKQLYAALGHPSKKKPCVVIANTIAGRGVPFMERKVDWHYWPLTEDLYKKAIRSVIARSESSSDAAIPIKSRLLRPDRIGVSQ